MKIEAKLTYGKVRYDQANKSHLVVSLKAPKLDWEKKRPSISVISVVDVSGSMAGEKLDYTKKSLNKLLEHLQPGDFFGLVTFTDYVTTVQRPVEVTQKVKEEIRTKIENLRATNSTNLSGGLLEGLELANKTDLPRDIINRVIVFTDGQANAGVAQKSPDIVKLLEANIGKATVSAFGYGNDCDQELMATLAKTGNGNYAFVGNPDDALTAFAKELGGLLSTYAENLTIKVTPHTGHEIVRVVSDVDADEDKDSVIIKVPSIMSEELRNLVLEVKLGEQSKAFPRETSVFDVRVAYDTRSENGKKASGVEEVKAKVQFVKNGEQDEKPEKEVDQVVGLAEMVDAQIQAEAKAKVGDYAGAAAFMRGIAGSFEERGLNGLKDWSVHSSGLIGSAQSYTSNASYFVGTKSVGTRGYGSSAPSAVMNFAAVNNVNVSNDAQADLVADFHDDQSGVVGVTGTVVPAPLVPAVDLSSQVVVTVAPVSKSKAKARSW